MVMVMKAPLSICFTKNLLFVQSVSKTFVMPFSADNDNTSKIDISNFLSKKTTVRTAASIRNVVCRVSVQTTVLIPPLKV